MTEIRLIKPRHVAIMTSDTTYIEELHQKMQELEETDSWLGSEYDKTTSYREQAMEELTGNVSHALADAVTLTQRQAEVLASILRMARDEAREEAYEWLVYLSDDPNIETKTEDEIDAAIDELKDEIAGGIDRLLLLLEANKEAES